MLSKIHTALSQGDRRSLKSLDYRAETGRMEVGMAIASNQL
jgi:hypothetical protein